MAGQKKQSKSTKRRIRHMENKNIMLKISDLLMRKELITVDEKLRLVQMIQHGDNV